MGNQPMGTRGEPSYQSRGLQKATVAESSGNVQASGADGDASVTHERRHTIASDTVDLALLTTDQRKHRSATEVQNSPNQARRHSLKATRPATNRTHFTSFYNAVGKKLGGSFKSEPEDMFDESTQQCTLTSETQEVLRRAFTDIDPKEIIDYHVHIVGHGDTGSGCFIHESTKQWYRPFRRLKTAVFMTAAQVPDMEGGDDQYVSRLARLVKHFVPSSALGQTETDPLKPPYQQGKLCLLAFDGYYDNTGEYRQEKTTLYVPNEYVYTISRDYPGYFVPVGSVNPYRCDALEELGKCSENGVTIIKWLPNSMGMNVMDEKCVPFYEKMKELDMALLVHVGEEHSVTAGFIDNSLGNPLFLRKPLDCGVKVIAAHCATEGSAIDIDIKTSPCPRVPCFELFMRLMREEKYKNLLFGDISAVCGFKRVEYLKLLLDATDIHDRLVYGSDYPVPAINLVVHTSKLRRVGLISADECRALNELYNYNPLLFDLVSKRLLRGPKGNMFPASVFKAHPLLPPYRTEHAQMNSCGEGVNTSKSHTEHAQINSPGEGLDTSKSRTEHAQINSRGEGVNTSKSHTEHAQIDGLREVVDSSCNELSLATESTEGDNGVPSEGGVIVQTRAEVHADATQNTADNEFVVNQSVPKESEEVKTDTLARPQACAGLESQTVPADWIVGTDDGDCTLETVADSGASVRTVCSSDQVMVSSLEDEAEASKL